MRDRSFSSHCLVMLGLSRIPFSTGSDVNSRETSLKVPFNEDRLSVLFHCKGTSRLSGANHPLIHVQQNNKEIGRYANQTPLPTL